MNFTENPQHFFECTYPTPKGEEVWRKHPKWPVEANNWGFLRPTNIEDEDEIYLSKARGSYGQTTNVNINGRMPGRSQRVRKHSAGGGLHKLIYECFYGKLPNNIQLCHYNFNPFDNRPENILIVAEQGAKEKGRRQLRREKFTRNTLIEMVKREKYFTPDSDMVEYFRIIGIPDMILERYKTYKETGEVKFSTVKDFGKPGTLFDYYDI